MSVYTTTLKRRTTPARDTLMITLVKPTDFAYQPGQFVTLHLPNDPSLVPGRGRYDFSLAGTPDEDELLLVMRMRQSAFKLHLVSLPLGTAVEIEGPFGTMVLPPDQQRHTVLLAGGIGIAPFRSMIRHLVSCGLPYPVTLFYSNPTQEHAVFLEEFISLSAQQQRLTVVPVMTRQTPAEGWTGATGYFTAELLQQSLADPVDAVYYIVGPVRMVIPTKRQIKSLGVAEEDIHMEIFTGY